MSEAKCTLIDELTRRRTIKVHSAIAYAPYTEAVW
jgi:hypothetical protein